ncbi:stage V sporulation protein T [Bacillus hwajinpoensis]|jgi:AbrB family transcriptional regulator, stage V sporulation protein T|uniref:Stage V sporulation protein T n=1 Tax=Guptibacillus hwajinpoensis TaxID=208199 RepID=A0A845F4E1_9BACL|nr:MULTISPECIES: stage V sporulation protein T [Bacillaceae]MYL65942.1 stage V sporulation protein T [Pseudalkalibacillus hwajinpoensis]PFG03315.1 transcriptional regulator, AbrB family [Bacillus sp. es.036]QHA90059.1 stage V sporulation protein T [Bacillus sp. N1-1]
MKATGIVRRIDDLGRVVIPKEIRRTLRIREGDPLEIFVDREGEVILKKYSPISELGDFAKEYAESLAEHSGHIALISDRDVYITTAGGPKKEYLNKSIGESVEKAMNERRCLLNESKSELIEGVPVETGHVIAPIIANGDPIGTVILLAKEDEKVTELEQKLSETAAGFLARQMEQ